MDSPLVSDAGAIWRIARDSGKLDLNSSYAYVLWCRDFADTSAVALIGGDVIGFVLGYLRPAAAETLMVWQVAVIEQRRGTGVAGIMIEALLRRIRPAYLETTISPDNAASARLFAGVAVRRGAALTRSTLFESSVFPDAHAAEDLIRIGPFPPASRHRPEESPPNGVRSRGEP